MNAAGSRPAGRDRGRRPRSAGRGGRATGPPAAPTTRQPSLRRRRPRTRGSSSVRRSPGRSSRAARAVLEAQEHVRQVLRLDRAVDALAAVLVACERLDRPGRDTRESCARCARSAKTDATRLPVMKLARSSQWVPMSATARSDPPTARDRAASSSRSSLQQPVLDVDAVDWWTGPELAAADAVARLAARAGRSGCCSSCSARGRSRSARRTQLRRLRRVQRQRLLADDVLAGVRAQPSPANSGGGSASSGARRRTRSSSSIASKLSYGSGSPGFCRARPGEEPTTPSTGTPRRRSASTWTTPMNPVPTTAVLITS